MKMKIVVLGAGSIGSLFGGMLARLGVNVVLIGRERHVRAIRERGLRLKDEKELVVDVKATSNPLDAGKADILLLTVKAYDTKAAALDAKPLMKRDTLVLCLQNGLGTEGEAAEILGKSRILRGVTSEGALLAAPGIVYHTGRGETIIGAPFTSLPSKVEEIVELFNEAGFDTRTSDFIEGDVWTKVLVNAGINPIGAITRLKNGEILKHPQLVEAMKVLVKEGVQVANKCKISFTENPVNKTIHVAKMTAENKNSMLQDLEKGKRTEIDYINGAIVRYGAMVGVDTPANLTVTAIIKALEERQRSREA